MSILETIQKPLDRAVMVTICGDSGMGKTSLAAAFPTPIFLRAEDGMQSVPNDKRPDAFPLVHKSADVWEQLTALCSIMCGHRRTDPRYTKTMQLALACGMDCHP